MPPTWELQTGERWSQEETSHHINYLELLAAFLALQCFVKHSNGITVQMKLDNHQQARGNALPGTLSARTHDLGLVCTEGCFSGCRTPTREGQYNSRSGIAINEGSLRLDAEPPGFRADTAADGPTTDRPVCIPTDEAAVEILQLETRPRSNCDRYV